MGFPIINHRDGVYWITDGQHRIYALRENGFENDSLECEVYENLSDEEMAKIFLLRDGRRAVDPFSKFHIACTANDHRATDIRRTVEANGLRVSKDQDENCIGAVSALGRVYDRDGATVLGQTLRTIKNAYAGDKKAFDAQVIDGVAMIFNRYNGATNEKDLAAKLGNATRGVHGLVQRAETMRLRTGNHKTQCIAAVAVDIYNQGRARNEKLPSWWKSSQTEE